MLHVSQCITSIPTNACHVKKNSAATAPMCMPTIHASTVQSRFFNWRCSRL